MAETAGTPPQASGAVAIKDPTGLHARPAVKLTKLAKTFEATVEIATAGQDRWISAKSPNAVMKLKAGHGAELRVRAFGDDAGAAVEAIVDLVDRDFED